MEFVVHNKRNITIKAAFIVAFFASFFTSADIYSDGSVPTIPPKTESVGEYQCYKDSYLNPEMGKVFGNSQDEAATACHGRLSDILDTFGQPSADGLCGVNNLTFSGHVYTFYAVVSYTNGANVIVCSPTATTKHTGLIGASSLGTVTTSTCPPDGFPDYILQVDTGVDTTACVDPQVLQDYLDSESALNKEESNCENLVLDSGNNQHLNMCYTSPTGSSCNVEMVQGAGYDYYKGVSSNPLGCANSDNPPFDNSGIGNESDDCITSNNTSFCSANKASHCTTDQGIETCDSGCIEINGNFMCDPSQHPDVGEGDSDYFDNNGTCSVVAGSAYKGACEELGGTWDKSGDYTDTSCPATSITGSCSVTTNGGCFACLDAGGTWTPDNTTPLNNTEKGIQDVASLTQETNDNLKVLDNSVRKGNESLISTIKSTNDKLMGEIKTLTGTGSGGIGGVISKLDELKEEKETFTTTTNNPNKSLINSLFDSAKITAVKAKSEIIKTDIQSFISTSKTEISSLLTVTVPSSSGYQARAVQMFGTSFDLSLNRMSDFFTLLAGPVMLLCSIIALFIILGKD